MAKNRIIGNEGKMPWYVKEEILHFKSSTMGYPVIMGRKTFSTFLKPLNGRQNIVLTKDKNFYSNFPDVKILHSIEEAFKYCETKLKAEKVFIIGGAEIFDYSIRLVDKMIISEMNFKCEGDSYFPEFDKEEWSVESEVKRNDFKIYTYIRKRKRFIDVLK